MEGNRDHRPEVEVLETSRPPGRLERLATSFLRRRWVRGVGAVALVTGVGTAIQVTAEDDEPIAVVQPESAPVAPVSPRAHVPPPWVTSGEVGWEVVGRPQVDPRSPVYVVEVLTLNRSSEARKPQDLRAVGRFAGRPGFRFSAPCTGFDQDATGRLRPLRSVVEPGEEILLRCTDTMEYSGNRPELVLRSLRVEAQPCEGEGRRQGRQGIV